MNSKLINCGERNIQSMYRISLKDICDRYGIKLGDTVEVYLKKVDPNRVKIEVELDDDFFKYVEENNLNLDELIHEWISEKRKAKQEESK